MGPSALRYAELDTNLRSLGHEVEDIGNIEAPVRDTLPESGGLGYLPSVVAACEQAYEFGRRAVADGYVPIFLGGDHSLSAGTVGGVTHEESCGVLWIDAHGDCNTPETSPSGNLHGMPLAALLGHGAEELVNVGRVGPKIDPSQVILIGIRDLDPQEKQFVRDSRMGVYTMHEIDERGIATVAKEALTRLSRFSRLHISLDMDSMDPRPAPGVGTPVKGGLTYREAHLLMEIISRESLVGSIDVVEINPILDDRNQTSEMAVELVSSLLGKSIL